MCSAMVLLSCDTEVYWRTNVYVSCHYTDIKFEKMIGILFTRNERALAMVGSHCGTRVYI